MPVSLPSSVTQTADGRDLYVPDNAGYPVGTVAYFNTVISPGGTPGGNVDMTAIFPIYTGGPVPVTGVGQGVPIPPGVYLARLSVPAVGDSPTGFTKGCFTLVWDGTQLDAGAVYSNNNFTTAGCFVSTGTNVTTGQASILTWGWIGLVSPSAAQIELVLLQQLPSITPLL